jgi:hypothetical protein
LVSSNILALLQRNFSQHVILGDFREQRIPFSRLKYCDLCGSFMILAAQSTPQPPCLGTGTKSLPQLCITASGHLCPISNPKSIKIACYSINFCDLRSNKFDPNLCAYLGKLFRPRSLLIALVIYNTNSDVTVTNSILWDGSAEVPIIIAVYSSQQL